MDQKQINDIAHTLHDARLSAQALPQFSASLKDFKREDAYSIQEKGIALRVNDGEKIIGLKMGLTSEGKRKQMNLDAPLYGMLTDTMQIEHEGRFSLQGSIHPKIEPEIVFYIDKDIKGKVTRDQVLESCSAVGAALEILDSRYEGFKYFSMEDVISDNSSSSHYILGPKTSDFKNIDLKNLEMKMYVNDELAQAGTSDAISGDPVVSVIQLAELLNQRGQFIPAGCFVLAGAATAAVNLEKRMQIKLEVQELETTKVSIDE
ncbi:MAG: 4-oxalocrotonate decarboxylase [Halobacteriovoraceae bacterium]|nr:4-oxalocrotonate decarboxylase [Halobacteriovoraceae bacterium]|tara:strand:- start:5266 stop:6051 length:786 start_codon:yes stop_codon:yes gene_type:complete